MSEDVRVFLQKNGFDESSIPKELLRIKDAESINPIVSDNGVYTEKEKTFVSIADILGYEYAWREVNPNIIESLSSFFDSEGDTYHSRSVGLLKYDIDELFKVVDKCNKADPMHIREIERGKYNISVDGLHRYSVLRMHYLMECSRCGFDPVLVDEISKKYTIPVILEKLDIEKTYSRYILMMIGAVKGMGSEYDSSTYTHTGNAIVHFHDGARTVMDNDTLIDFVNNRLADSIENKYPDCGKYFASKCTSSESFTEYVNKYIPLVACHIKEKGGISDGTKSQK